jgi:hypothetical protein
MTMTDDNDYDDNARNYYYNPSDVVVDDDACVNGERVVVS